MKHISFNHHFLLRFTRQAQLTIIVVVLFGTKLFSQQIINNGGTIVMSGAAYMVVNNASFINNGTFVPSTGTVSFTGSGAASSAYSIGTTNTTPSLTPFYNLTINNIANTIIGTVNPDVSVANTLSVSSGTLACGTATPATNLTLLSTSTNTADVSAVTGVITGYVNVERYLPAKRAWRLLTAPVRGTGTTTGNIFSTWQISGAATANRGMFITGPGAINQTPTSSNNGLDYTTRTSSSMKTWSYGLTTPAYTAVSSTNTPISTNNGNAGSPDNIGYFVFVRGDRTPANIAAFSTSTSVTTLTSVGPLQTGMQTFALSATAAAGSYVLMGNPYAAPVDITKVLATATTTNVNYTFYTWDASLATVGAFVTFQSTDGVTYSKSPTSSQTTVLQSGQAFFVKTIAANTATSLVFKEAYKSTSVLPTAGFKPNTVNNALDMNSSLRANLYYVHADSSIALADGNLTQFNNSYSDSVVDNEDAIKLINTNENLGLSRHNATLAIESRPNLMVTDTIFLHLVKTTQRAYRFQFEPLNLDNSNLVGYLQDKYLNTSTEISLSNTTPIDFAVDANAGSAAADRFQIVFKTVLPFAFTNIAATKNNSDIAVEWKVANETDIAQYDVEKSANGTSFTKVNTNLVKGINNAANSYIWLDENAQIGDNIYRVKMWANDGSSKYTDNVKVTIADINTGIHIYPNPIKEGKVNIQMGNQPSGNYQLSITNNNGQVVYTGTVQNNSNRSSFLINLNTLVAKGIYNLQITTPQNKISTRKLIVE